MTTTKKPTTKKPAAKKTAVKKLHYGGDSGFPPRGRRTLGDPRRVPRRRRPLGRPRRPGGPLLGPDDRPIRAPGIGRPQMPRGRNPQIMTPAMRRRLMELRKRAEQRRQFPTQQIKGVGNSRQITPAMRRQMELARRRFNQQRRRRRPTQAIQTPKVATPRKRPTGTPRGPQVTPRRRPIGTFRPRGNRGRKIK